MSHKSRIGVIVIDCKSEDFERDVRFWSAALGRPAEKEPRKNPRYASLESPGDDIALLVQKVDHDSRLHLDIETDDIESETRRLEALGASRVVFVNGWQVMEAPSGHRFCIIKPQRQDFDDRARSWPDASDAS